MAIKTKPKYEVIHVKVDTETLAVLRKRAADEFRTLHNTIQLALREAVRSKP